MKITNNPRRNGLTHKMIQVLESRAMPEGEILIVSPPIHHGEPVRRENLSQYMKRMYGNRVAKITNIGKGDS